MWLILTALATIITTVIWYAKSPGDKYKLSLLSLMFWGATLMWLVDHVMAYLTEGGEFFEINMDATLLGISVIILALLVWLIVLLVSDPKGVIRRALRSEAHVNR
jgi:peptidoglycan biosynthesis protein MviN/MurJ (putative lipid II flippase)